ncbi:MAG: ribosome-associated translation inhibitor RaiA [Paludibacteraceae bacterium]|jgi:putative sigma-54 modulation protein|nr:ribosome-associated translation inhibitor RaiA [Bacteroidales bacterium]MBO7315897.1 ribosome-associated translation inhibitor RaiA [Paludibacteraceae bacterium]MBQ1279719.1 ribosome-associated translation inhibitor RaiA [Bacteroidales bacterium]MBQ5882795.1 ribosome-associated translation inhibitor RaiA [Bacteroidales bacterium]MBR4974795.1 ribosome-associated translation inhibitor RaiA [Bacteroidales bacterium]
MKINVQSIKFDADQKLLDFIDKKVGKLSKFFDNIISCDVNLTLQPDHKKSVKIILGIPGDDIVIERTADTFEDAVVDCVDVLQDQIIKIKEKRFGK